VSPGITAFYCLHRRQIDAIDAAANAIDHQVDALDEPFYTIVQMLTTPGVEELGARIIFAEIGRDTTRFPTAGHLISWAGLCPRNHASPRVKPVG
jgi:transposase